MNFSPILIHGIFLCIGVFSLLFYSLYVYIAAKSKVEITIRFLNLIWWAGFSTPIIYAFEYENIHYLILVLDGCSLLAMAYNLLKESSNIMGKEDFILPYIGRLKNVLDFRFSKILDLFNNKNNTDEKN